MKLTDKTPLESLNKAYSSSNINEGQINSFKTNLKILFDDCHNAELKGEEETHFRDILLIFLNNTYYNGVHKVISANKKDMVIHVENSTHSDIGVIIEIKRPKNKGEMISKDNLNAKAMQELLHYYIEERLKKEKAKQNPKIKYLIITSVYEWFIFDAIDFERFFFENEKLIIEYKEWEEKKSVGTGTKWLYQKIAQPFIEKQLIKSTYTYFDLRDIKTNIENQDNNSDEVKKLIPI